MDFVYYIVRKRDMVILDGAKDMVSAINMGQQQNCACLILQACVITEIGQDIPEENVFEQNFEDNTILNYNDDIENTEIDDDCEDDDDLDE